MNKLKTLNKGTLFVISAPSGAGKTTVVLKLLRNVKKLKKTISHTTRPRRPGEKSGKDYFFITDQKFRKMVANREFVEWTEVYGRKYGTSKFGLERFINGFLDLLSISFVSKYKKKPMHFFGSLGILSFLIGFFITAWLIGEKLVDIYFTHTPVHRDITDKPLFYISLVAIIAGIQMFLAGFIGEMITMSNVKKGPDYLVSEKI